MTSIRLIIAILLLLLAAFIAVMNWICVIVSLRNMWRGIDQRPSTIPLVSFVITIVAGWFYHWSWMIAVPLLDVGNWTLLLPFLVIGDTFRKKD